MPLMAAATVSVRACSCSSAAMAPNCARSCCGLAPSTRAWPRHCRASSSGHARLSSHSVHCPSHAASASVPSSNATGSSQGRPAVVGGQAVSETGAAERRRGAIGGFRISSEQERAGQAVRARARCRCRSWGGAEGWGRRRPAGGRALPPHRRARHGRQRGAGSRGAAGHAFRHGCRDVGVGWGMASGGPAHGATGAPHYLFSMTVVTVLSADLRGP